MFRRIILVCLSLFVLLFLATSIALWFFLSSWIPSVGKAKLIQELERRAPVTVAIGDMRYEWLRDVVLTGVQIRERRSHETWFAAPQVSVHVNWLAFALRNICIFDATSPVDAPFKSLVRLSGRFDFRQQALSATVKTEAISLASVAPFLRKQLPAALTEAKCRITASAEQAPAKPLLLQGRLSADSVVWEFSPGRLSGQATIDALASRPRNAAEPWAIEADVALHDAAVQDLPIAGAVESLNAKAHYEHEIITVSQLEAKALGADWQAQGSVGKKYYELFLAAPRAQLGPFFKAIPDNKQKWNADGLADLQAVCRGAAGPQSRLPDCTIVLKPQEAKISGGLFSYPLQHINGRLQYELLSRQLTLDGLRLKVMDEPLAISGTLRLAQPPDLSLSVAGLVPLAAVKDWLGPHSPVTGLGGLAQTDVTLAGPLSQLSIEGRIDLKDTLVQTAGANLTEINGAFILRKSDLVVQALHLKMNGHPLSIVSTFKPSPFMAPREPGHFLQVVADLGSPEGRCTLKGRLGPETFFIDNGILTLEKTRLRIAGAVARQAAQPSQFSASGTLALEELSELPFDIFHPLIQWRLKGLSDVDLEFEGPLGDFNQARLEAHLRADRLTVRDVPLEKVAVALEQQRGALHVSVPETYIADGKLVGDLNVTARQKQHVYRMQADLAGLELGQLRGAIPAWKERAVTGHASTHAAMAGIWEQRPSWVGDGWLNVEGQELGDLPLLDKLFRGLFGVLAERLGGLDNLRRAQITQASLTWQLISERVRTNDLRLGGVAGTEPVAVYAKGSVGLDQTLDLVIEPELSEGVLLQAPTTSTLANTILKAADQLERLRRLIGRHRLTGTLKKPEYRFELGAQDVLKQFNPAPANLLQQGLQGILDAVRPQESK